MGMWSLIHAELIHVSKRAPGSDSVTAYKIKSWENVWCSNISLYKHSDKKNENGVLPIKWTVDEFVAPLNATCNSLVGLLKSVATFGHQ